MATRANSPAPPSRFELRTVLKRDVFSEVSYGHFVDDPQTVVTRRRVSHARPWIRWFAWFLARREIAALRRLDGAEGTPRLLGVDRDGLYRSWIEGAPLHVAKPMGNEAYFRDAKRLLRQLHRRGITHNDLAKPQNWLMTTEGRAALIDMQLATVFRHRGKLFRLLAREDLRHLLKQKRSFCRAALTPAEKRMLAAKSLPAQVWMKTVKPLYNLVTRGLFRWSDGEGTKDRMDTDGKVIRARLEAEPAVQAAALSVFPYPKRAGVGLYAFVEPAGAMMASAVEKRIGGWSDPKPDLVQCVAALPRDADGRIREDLLRLVAINQVDELDRLRERDPQLHALMRAIAADRRNLTDRRLRG
ncbi:serine/threonine protein kinase [Aurantimonas sp. MSK8Z-1]|uniref:serine/threonine protein kinase n=1 Tax=Mangrovibrevibacter kandeliae TaxID=2968473 RepID=UPI0021199CA1|nr:serine/threonine protein kinase [Aurantimonas sp. MSK8Z-1]MCW4114294.1 serine/threonine protein kinase [Aurantimonas sp. MSK8Z-1]